MGSMLQKDRFDLILLECNLSDWTGLQALEAIRLDPNNRGAATIMIAEGGQNERAIEALKRGLGDFIIKDDLSPAALRRAAINALQKAQMFRDLERHQTGRKDMKAVLRRFSSRCANEIKPVLSQMIHQLQEFRDAPKQDPETSAGHYRTIEKSCMRLWNFLEDLERHQGKDLLANGPTSTMQSETGIAETRERPVRPVSVFE